MLEVVLIYEHACEGKREDHLFKHGHLELVVPEPIECDEGAKHVGHECGENDEATVQFGVELQWLDELVGHCGRRMECCQLEQPRVEEAEGVHRQERCESHYDSFGLHMLFLVLIELVVVHLKSECDGVSNSNHAVYDQLQYAEHYE